MDGKAPMMAVVWNATWISLEAFWRRCNRPQSAHREGEAGLRNPGSAGRLRTDELNLTSYSFVDTLNISWPSLPPPCLEKMERQDLYTSAPS
jgi:hypothetical protein